MRSSETKHLNNITGPLRLNIGCGHRNKIEGFVGVDLIAGPGVDIAAPAYEIPLEDNVVDEIVAEHLIEHLTYYQFQLAMAEWYRILKPRGTLTIECPDFEAVCRGFAEANEYERYVSVDGSWSWSAQLHGHQRGKTEEEQMSQVHKSSYTYEHLYNVLTGLRYGNITKRTPKKSASGPCIRIEATKL